MANIRQACRVLNSLRLRSLEKSSLACCSLLLLSRMCLKHPMLQRQLWAGSFACSQFSIRIVGYTSNRAFAIDKRFQRYTTDVNRAEQAQE